MPLLGYIPIVHKYGGCPKMFKSDFFLKRHEFKIPTKIILQMCLVCIGSCHRCLYFSEVKGIHTDQILKYTKNSKHISKCWTMNICPCSIFLGLSQRQIAFLGPLEWRNPFGSKGRVSGHQKLIFITGVRFLF